MKLKTKKTSVSLAGLLLSAMALTACGGSPEPGANQYSVPKADGAGLATTARTLESLSAQRTTVKAYDLSGQDRKVSETDEWKVCTQDLEPGTNADFTAKLEVGVVKAEELCPTTGFKKDVKKLVETGITTTAPEVKKGWDFPSDVTNKPLADVVKLIDANQEGSRTNFTAVDVVTASPVAFSSSYKICFTSPSDITKVDPKSNLAIGLFVTKKDKKCMTEAQFNAAG